MWHFVTVVYSRIINIIYLLREINLERDKEKVTKSPKIESYVLHGTREKSLT